MEPVLFFISVYCFIWAAILIGALITMFSRTVANVHRYFKDRNPTIDVVFCEIILVGVIAGLMTLGKFVL